MTIAGCLLAEIASLGHNHKLYAVDIFIQIILKIKLSGGVFLTIPFPARNFIYDTLLHEI